MLESQIISYLSNNGEESKKCVILPSKVNGTKSAKVRISLEDKDRY